MAAKTNTTQTLTKAQADKLGKSFTPAVCKRIGVKTDDEKKNLQRFADKWLRNKLGIRNTGPHSHGFSAEQRKGIREVIVAAFPEVAPKPRAPKKAQPAKSSNSRKGTARRSGGKRSTAQLAKAQTERAQS